MKGDGGWSPYVAGALSGLVSVGSVWFVGKFLGASTTLVPPPRLQQQKKQKKKKKKKNNN